MYEAVKLTPNSRAAANLHRDVPYTFIWTHTHTDIITEDLLSSLFWLETTMGTVLLPSKLFVPVVAFLVQESLSDRHRLRLDKEREIHC